MNSKEFNQHRKEFFETAMSLSDAKSVEYTISNEDRLYNFKHVAARLGTTPEQALMVYVLKHVDAICNDAKTGVQVSDETVMSRAMDICNYMVLYTGLKKEPQPDEDNTKPVGTEHGIVERNGKDDSEPKKWNELSQTKT
ncbi:MAG: hypothetical protein CMC15_18075 [Flavobacteriaceae bacterium]|nr:hypothetical protein [Flavobacteriaceae bacterium]|tara:strand:+ start:876 stop:1295 length:420 start_codon:yes stop_codon:yes gene_type:complete